MMNDENGRKPRLRRRTVATPGRASGQLADDGRMIERSRKKDEDGMFRRARARPIAPNDDNPNSTQPQRRVLLRHDRPIAATPTLRGCYDPRPRKVRSIFEQIGSIPSLLPDCGRQPAPEPRPRIHAKELRPL